MAQKQSNKKFTMGLAVAFLLPLSFYLIAKIMSKDKIFLPRYYNVERVDSQLVNGVQHYDSIYHKAGEVTLTNQLGDVVSLNKDLQGKVLLVDLFFTQCGTICPKLTSNMTMLQRAFRKNDTAVHLLSISVDPVRDSPSVLKMYADRYGANHDHWWFLTGDAHAIYEYTRNELKLLSKPADGGVEHLDHSQTLVLLDKNRYVRGYYNGLDTADLRRCADDIILLSLEKHPKP
jgi:protein SCO1/2